jgi:hypothetical protein
MCKLMKLRTAFKAIIEAQVQKKKKNKKQQQQQ